MGNLRDFAMYAAIFGLFGMVWFGWAQERPPKAWRAWLGIGSALSAVIGLVGIYLAATHWRSPSALVGKEAYITFGVIVATECLFAGVGAALLAKKKKPAYIPAWIAFVVGVHFLPLAWLFNDPWLYALTALASGAPVAAVAISRKTKVAISALTGLFMGLTLLAFGLRGLYVFFA